jgi:hypothetical protein
LANETTDIDHSLAKTKKTKKNIFEAFEKQNPEPSTKIMLHSFFLINILSYIISQKRHFTNFMY